MIVKVNAIVNSCPRCFLLCLVTAAVLSFGGGCALRSPTLVIKETGQSYSAHTIISARTGKPVSFEEMLDDLKTAGMVYIGETHTDPAHHEIQLQIMQAMYRACPR